MEVKKALAGLLACGLLLAPLVHCPASTTHADGPEPYLVKDINVTTGDSIPGELVDVGGTLYFVADDGSHGQELWKTDGTQAGTILVSDILPGSEGSSPSWLTTVGDTLFFSADDGTHGRELWSSDGTEAGTVMVKDIWPGASSSALWQFASFNGELFFAADDNLHGFELWKSDGSEAGTVLVKDIWPGSGGSSPGSLTSMGGALYFAANSVAGSDLWRSDGTETGTSLVKSIQLGPPRSLTAVNGTLFFTAAYNGSDLWKSDGTEAGTVIVQQGGSKDSLTNVNGTLFFRNNAGAHGRELWKSDGTEAGTVLVKDINPGAPDSDLAELRAFDGLLFFRAEDGTHGPELWRSDGTEAGTVMVKETSPGDLFPRNLTIAHGRLFFAAGDANHGAELWGSDGTEEGTVLVRDIYPGQPSSIPAGWPNEPVFGTAGDTLYLGADDGSHGLELWVSDGTEAGTALVKDVNLSGAGAHIVSPSGVDGTLFFGADDKIHGPELWKSDGTEAGTTIVKDIQPGFRLGLPADDTSFASIDGTVFFRACDDEHGCELWKSDGTANGTVLVKDIVPAGWSDIRNLVAVQDLLFFTAQDTEHGSELWKSDGTEAGTALVRDINPLGEYSSPNALTEVNGILFFTAEDGTHGRELWRSDGTAEGTVLVKDIGPGQYSSSGPGCLENFDGTLFFSADDGNHGYELWKTDGTEAGTVMVKDIGPSGGASSPCGLTVANGLLFFGADDGSHGRELWKSDGTVEGTVMVKDISSDWQNPSSSPEHITEVDGIVMFRACEDTHGCELWKSDGTEEGTTLVRDISPGADTSFLSGPRELRSVDGMLYFRIDDGVHGQELWQSDATEAGTVQVKDIWPGKEGSTPEQLTSMNACPSRLLFFSADDGLHGRELWALEAASCPCPVQPVLASPDDDALACDETLTLEWQPIDGATWYRIQIAKDKSFSTRVVNKSISGTSYQPSPRLSPGTYHWRVRATEECGDSDWSSSRSFEVQSMPPKPVLSSPSDSGTVCEPRPPFSWSRLDGATSYRIQVGSDAHFSPPVLDEVVSEASFTPAADLSPGDYHWRVRGLNVCGEGNWSQVWRFARQAVPTMTVLSSPPNGSSTVDSTPAFAWTPTDGATAYQIQVAADQVFASPVVDAALSEPSYKPMQPLAPGGYWWRVRGTNECGVGIWSSSWHLQCQRCLHLPLVIRERP